VWFHSFFICTPAPASSLSRKQRRTQAPGEGFPWTVTDLSCCVQARRGACAGCFQTTFVFRTNKACSAKWRIPSPRSLPDRSKKKTGTGNKRLCRAVVSSRTGLVSAPVGPFAYSRNREPGVPLKLSSKGESCVSLPLFRLLQRLLRLRSLRALRKCERKAKNEPNLHAQLRRIRNQTTKAPMLTGLSAVDAGVHRERKNRCIVCGCFMNGAVKCTEVMRFSRFGLSVSAQSTPTHPGAPCCPADRASPA
jgi:hypothetical protein